MMPAGFPVTEHGGGLMGIRGCSCELCKVRRQQHRCEVKDAKRKAPRRPVALWETYNGTPTRSELLEARG